MKALIVEDEKLAQQTLQRALERNFPDIEVVAITESVKGTLAWLRTPGNTADLIFMDVELQDGSAFEIFKQETITAKVIMTTAFDKYAVKAFEAGSMDYLLKPYDDEALLRAVSRCQAASENFVEGKSKYIVKNDGTRYFFDQQMESILDDLDPQVFFRISRNFIISSYAIHGIERIYGGRLKILMTPPPETDMIVARSRVSDFMAWLA